MKILKASAATPLIATGTNIAAGEAIVQQVLYAPLPNDFPFGKSMTIKSVRARIGDGVLAPDVNVLVFSANPSSTVFPTPPTPLTLNPNDIPKLRHVSVLKLSTPWTGSGIGTDEEFLDLPIVLGEDTPNAKQVGGFYIILVGGGAIAFASNEIITVEIFVEIESY